MPPPLVEVRIPTHKRPELLRRALSGLMEQTYPHWRAIVLDDSPDREGAVVCATFNEPRIAYQPNPRNLGMALNISKAFRPAPFVNEARYGCVLEDDNSFEPSLLEKNLQAIKQAQLPVLVRNYKLVEIQASGEIRGSEEEPMRLIYGSAPREIPFQERVMEAFFNFTLGNLSYFWEFHRGVDLSAAEEPFNSPSAEPLRAVSFRSACWYEPEPLAVFSRFPQRQKKIPATPADQNRARLARLSEILLTRKLMQMRREAHPNVEEGLLETAQRRACLPNTLQALAEAGSWKAFVRLRNSTAWVRVLKGIPLWLKYKRRHDQLSAQSAAEIRNASTTTESIAGLQTLR